MPQEMAAEAVSSTSEGSTYTNMGDDLCSVERVLPAEYMACNVVHGDFRVARDAGTGCRVTGNRYSCYATPDERFYVGDYQLVDIVHGTTDCQGLCGPGAVAVVVQHGDDELYLYEDYL